jgi:hypothetical protein
VPSSEDRQGLEPEGTAPPSTAPPSAALGTRGPRPPQRRRSLWDGAILLLGLNLWVTFLLLPSLFLLQRGLPAATLGVLCLSPMVLILGVLRRSEALLLALFPVLLALGPITFPSLVGVNVYTPASFALVAASFIAYSIGTTLLLGTMTSPEPPNTARLLAPVVPDAKWRRRYRVYRVLTIMSGIFPLGLVFVLFFHPGVQEDLVRYFPRRHQSALSFFGVLLLLLWIVLFYAEFMTPLRAHVRGDPDLHSELAALRQRNPSGRPSFGFYAFIALALILMSAYFVLGR